MTSPAPRYDGRPADRRPTLRAVASETSSTYAHQAVLERLERTLDQLFELHPDELQDGEVDGELIALETAKRRLAARTTDLVAAKTSRQAERARQANPGDGRAEQKAAKQVAQDLAGALNIDERDASRLVKDGRSRRLLSRATREASASGRLSPEHTRLLHDQLLRHLDGDLRREVETEMVELGQTMDARAFGRACRKRLGELDRGALQTDDRRRQQRRRASVTQNPDGTVYLSGTFAGSDGETLLTAMHAFMTPDAEGQPRTGEQRTADAIVSMARCALDHADLGKQGGTKPHVTVFVTWQDLIGGGTAELPHTGPVSVGELRTLLDDCTITRIVTGPDSQILDVGRASRTVPPAVRRAIEARDRHCTYPGCTVAASRCQAAHIGKLRWFDGAGTSASEQALLCLMHHQLVDRLHLTAQVVDGQVLWDRPGQG